MRHNEGIKRYNISQKIADLLGKTILIKCSTQESHSKFSVTNQKDKDLWEEPSNSKMRPQQATRLKIWKADGDDGGGNYFLLHMLNIQHTENVIIKSCTA
jgi:hypothetical protein